MTRRDEATPGASDRAKTFCSSRTSTVLRRNSGRDRGRIKRLPHWLVLPPAREAPKSRASFRADLPRITRRTSFERPRPACTGEARSLHNCAPEPCYREARLLGVRRGDEMADALPPRLASRRAPTPPCSSPRQPQEHSAT